jgi:tRNA threonylcarbamoyladenosine biosynthesis protein TsaB
VELTIDTASEMASVALSHEGSLEAELTWRCPRNHSVELLPTIEHLMRRSSVDKSDLTAVFVCIGPGSYTGLRVGVSTAKGLAFALRLAIVGVGRLDADAYQHADYRGPVCALHRAGRGELAWALYQSEPAWREIVPPRLSPPEALLADRRLEGALFCGEISDELTESLRGAFGPSTAIARPAASIRRAATIAELAWQRLAGGDTDDASSLKPIYLREPAITRPRSDRK